MEANGYNLDTVHVVRQGFLPNAPFTDVLSSLVKPGLDEPRLFSVWGSDEVEVDAYESVGMPFMQQKHAADLAYEARRHMLVQPSLEFSARMLQATAEGKKGNVALQLVMKPANFDEFSSLRDTLDRIKVGRRRHAFGFTATRLYLDVPVEQLRDLNEVKAGIATIRSRLPAGPDQSSLLQLIPHDRLHGEFTTRPPVSAYQSAPSARRAS